MYFKEYQNTPRKQWVQEWPGQVVICVGSIFWTQEVHEAINMGADGLNAYLKVLHDQLGDIVDLVRGKLTTQQRITLGALVVIDVHARDVIHDIALKGNHLGLLLFLAAIYLLKIIRYKKHLLENINK
jgi:dynein heavy chain